MSNKKLNINDEIVSDLKMKLTSAENKLTDIRLEALSSVHHVDQLKECLDKIKVIAFQNVYIRKYKILTFFKE